MTFDELYAGYVTLAHRGYCPVFIPTESGLFSAVIAPKERQLGLIEARPVDWLVESVCAVRELAVGSGYRVKG